MSQGPREVAQSYLERGWAPIPVLYQHKEPGYAGWPDLRVTIETLDQRFNGAPQNIGVLLGEPSKGLVDIDLDAREALSTGAYYLPETAAIFGRSGKRAVTLSLSDRSNPAVHDLPRPDKTGRKARGKNPRNPIDARPDRLPWVDARRG